MEFLLGTFVGALIFAFIMGAGKANREYDIYNEGYLAGRYKEDENDKK